MKIDVEGHATIDIHIEDMSAGDAQKLLRELTRLEKMLPDEFPQSVHMFMDALHRGISYISGGKQLFRDEEL